MTQFVARDAILIGQALGGRGLLLIFRRSQIGPLALTFVPVVALAAQIALLLRRQVAAASSPRLAASRRDDRDRPLVLWYLVPPPRRCAPPAHSRPRQPSSKFS
jgi:hypothetical protein